MKYYPICLDVRDKPCLVVGGGGVGTRKVRTLVECGGRVTVVAPEASREVARRAAAGEIAWKQRTYEPGDVAGMFLVIGATSDMTINEGLSRDAAAENILCNIADVPRICNFILPAVIQQGDLQVTVSTTGKSPAFAKHLKRELEEQFGPEYAVFLDLMGRIRARLLAEAHEPEAHKHLFETLIKQGLLDMIRSQDRAAMNRLLAETLGEAFTLDRLEEINDNPGGGR